MKNLLFLLTLVFAFSTLTATAGDSIPTLEFKISANKEYEARFMVLNIEIAVNNDDFPSAVDRCNSVLDMIIRNVTSISPGKIEAVLRRLNSLPDSKFFDDYSRVRLFAEIKIKDKTLINGVFSEIKNFKEATITDVGFEYDNMENIKNDLLADIAKLAKERVMTIEQNFGLKLELINFEDDDSDYEATTFMSNSVYMNNNSNSLIRSRANETVSRTRKSTDPEYNLDYRSLTYFPVREFEHTVNLRYRIVKK